MSLSPEVYRELARQLNCPMTEAEAEQLSDGFQLPELRGRLILSLALRVKPWVIGTVARWGKMFIWNTYARKKWMRDYVPYLSQRIATDFLFGTCNCPDHFPRMGLRSGRKADVDARRRSHEKEHDLAEWDFLRFSLDQFLARAMGYEEKNYTSSVLNRPVLPGNRPPSRQEIHDRTVRFAYNLSMQARGRARGMLAAAFESDQNHRLEVIPVLLCRKCNRGVTAENGCGCEHIPQVQEVTTVFVREHSYECRSARRCRKCGLLYFGKQKSNCPNGCGGALGRATSAWVQRLPAGIVPPPHFPADAGQFLNSPQLIARLISRLDELSAQLPDLERPLKRMIEVVSALSNAESPPDDVPASDLLKILRGSFADLPDDVQKVILQDQVFHDKRSQR